MSKVPPPRSNTAILRSPFFFETVGERGRGRLVDDAEHVQAGDLAGVLGGLALRVVEVGRHRDDGIGDRLAEIVLGGLLHLLQDPRRDLGRATGLAAEHHVGGAVVGLDDLVRQHLKRPLDLGVLEAASDEALDGVDRVDGVGHRLATSDLTDEALTVVVGRHHRRSRAPALAVRDHGRLSAFHHCDAGVGRSEVDADYLSHRAHPEVPEKDRNTSSIPEDARRFE